jgi:transcriptional regulator with XRE-family HTH domain
MENTLGKRIAALRRQKELTQDNLAQILDVSSQAVSKWENDQTCPDISLLPQLAKMLGVSVDELLSGKSEQPPVVQMLPKEKQKDINDMMLRIIVDSAAGDKVRVNFPLALAQAAIDMGMELPNISGSSVMKSIDLKQIMELVQRGAMGNLVDVESADGDTVHILVE